MNTYSFHFISVEFTDDGGFRITLHDVSHLITLQCDGRFHLGPVETLLLEFLAELEFKLKNNFGLVDSRSKEHSK